ncbi:ORF6N domain-containing protein [Flavobacterium sp. GSP11]
MLDKDLAELYAVETKQLKRQVRRNIERFPEDFMFELSPQEFDNLRSQFGTSNWGDTRYVCAYGIYRTRRSYVVECS